MVVGHVFPSGPCIELQAAYACFKTFLEMAATQSQGQVVPTPDIDLIWHTTAGWSCLQVRKSPEHATLTHTVISRDCVLELFGFYLDHMSLEEDTVGHGPSFIL